jgi:hypothetical protein
MDERDAGDLQQAQATFAFLLRIKTLTYIGTCHCTECFKKTYLQYLCLHHFLLQNNHFFGRVTAQKTLGYIMEHICVLIEKDRQYY